MSLHNPSQLPVGRDQAFSLDGPAGRLQCLAYHDFQTTQARPIIAIICHPHPLYQGTMHNKVVHTLSRLYGQLAIASIRFNFRGVSDSEGQYDNGVGEIDDLLAVMVWVRQHYPRHKLALAGFSFGSYIAASNAHHDDVHHLITVAPPVTRFPFARLKPIRCPWLIVQGDKDTTVDANDVIAWQKRTQSGQLIMLAGADHFFHGYLVDLKKQLAHHMAPWLSSK